MFIVFEGLDRSGKSTQSKLLNEKLKNSVKIIFPDRTTYTGKIINDYLQGKVKMTMQEVHLLFSMNRWEKVKYIKDCLKKGITVICDRYYYSGLAYSSSLGLDYEWCKGPDKGLPQPDIVFLLKADIISLSKRGNYGEEIYEKLDFQRKVDSYYDRMLNEEDNFVLLDACQSKEELHKDIMSIIDN